MCVSVLLLLSTHFLFLLCHLLLLLFISMCIFYSIVLWLDEKRSLILGNWISKEAENTQRGNTQNTHTHTETINVDSLYMMLSPYPWNISYCIPSYIWCNTFKLRAYAKSTTKWESKKHGARRLLFFFHLICAIFDTILIRADVTTHTHKHDTRHLKPIERSEENMIVKKKKLKKIYAQKSNTSINFSFKLRLTTLPMLSIRFYL